MINTPPTANGQVRPRKAGIDRWLDRSKMPHNIELEVSVLGGVLLRNAALDDIPDLEVDDFYDWRHQIVWIAMRTLQQQQKPIDTVTLEVEIEKAGKLEAVGGVAYLGELALRVPTADNVVAYAEEVRTKARNRKVLVALASALERGQDWPHEPYELLGETVGELQRIEAFAPIAATKKSKWAVDLGDFLGDEEPSDDDREDWIIRDIIPRAEAALIAGPQKGGKTWSAIDLCIAVATGQKWMRFENTFGSPQRVIGVFLEDSKRRLRKRLWELCRARGTTPNSKVLREHLAISQVPFRLPDERVQRELAAEVKAFGAVLVVVDNISRVMLGDQNKTTDAVAFTDAWQKLIRETGASIAFLHHTKKPTGDDLRGGDPFNLIRGSGDFGASARNIVLTLPVRTDGGDKISEVRMRGNIDLEHESFVLGFERKKLDAINKWCARLIDRGEIETVKGEVEKARKESKAERKRIDAREEMERRKVTAIRIAQAEKYVSSARLANELGLSARAVAPVLQSLAGCHPPILRAAGTKGYELTDADRQEGMSL